MTTPSSPLIEQPFSPNKVGGSSARLTLVTEGEQQRFRKEEFRRPSKLKAQYEWLMERQELPHIPRVLGCEEREHGFSYEMPFYADASPLVTYIHQHPLETTSSLLLELVSFVRTKIHTNPVQVTSRDLLERYLEEKVEHKLHACAEDMDGIHKLLKEEEIVINGYDLLNVPTIIKQIRQNDTLMEQLSTFQKCPVHGDLTVENVLVSRDGTFLLLDPNNENWISTPLVDFAKMYQSLHSGYEFMEQARNVQRRGNHLSFEAASSPHYNHLFSVLSECLQQSLTAQEMLQIVFHEGVHFARMLPYKARSSRPFFWVYYARMVWLFNEFYQKATRNTP